nr:hypothetical protein GTC16762_14140 [Pigmentibacter ruber]
MKIKLYFTIYFIIFISIISCNNQNNVNDNKNNISLEESNEKKLISKLDELLSKNKKKIKVSDFNIYLLKDDELFNIIDILNVKKNTNIFYSKLYFEVKDEIIRRAHLAFLRNDINQLSKFYSFDFIKKINFEKELFLNLSCSNCKSYEFIEKSYITLDPGNYPSKKDYNIRVIIGSFEAPNARLGGIGEFLSGILNAELISLKSPTATDKIEASLLTPFYDFLKIKYYDNVTFVGFINHFLDDKIVKSTIYKIVENGFTQYLVQPDPNYQFINSKKQGLKGWDIFDVVQQTNVYDIFRNEAGWLYYSGALSSFSTLFKGEKGHELFDIVHMNGKLFSISNIIQLKFNEKRALLSLPKIGILSTIHDNHSGNKSNLKPFERLGLQKPTGNSYNRITLAVETSHMVNFVSKSTENDIINPNFWPKGEEDIPKAFEKIKNEGRFVGINNAIFFDNFDITSPKVLGKLFVEKDYSNYKNRKIETKNVLFKNGIIGSPILPLYVFVGRFADNKGIDVLAEFAKDIVKNHSGQVVIMGASSGKLPKEIIEIEKIAGDPSSNGLIKLFKDFDKDQLSILTEINASKGKLIRFASDFTLVPSKVEAAGLVPVEGLSFGSATISSYKEGLIDQCTNPYGKGFDIKNFTCIPFERDNNSTQVTLNNLKVAINNALSEWNILSEDEKIKVQKNLIMNAKTFDWNASGGTFEQYVILFKKTIEEANK